MSKTLAYHVLGIGRLPRKIRKALEVEGILHLDEGLRSSITHRNFSAPGRRHSWRRDWFSGAIVMTEKRFAAFARRKPILNVPFDEPRFSELHSGLDEEERLIVRFDAGAFNESHSGSIELCFATPHAGLYLDRLPQAAPSTEQ